jgi:DNA adenine methylase
LRYLGGKFKLAPWIMRHFPPHRVYVEAFAGAASVLLRKPRSQGECLNDINGDIVSLFKVLRDRATAGELCRQLSMTPFSCVEYDAAFVKSDDPVEAARRLIVRSFMGHGSSAATSDRTTGFRASMVNRGGALPAGEWPRLPPALEAVTERLQGVLIEQRPALQIIERYDSADALFYLDPPYMHATRSDKRRGRQMFHAYANEMSDADHAELLAVLPALKGMVVLSGYPTPEYDAALQGWRREEIGTHADGALDRTEVLWINPAAADRIATRSLFAAAS